MEELTNCFFGFQVSRENIFWRASVKHSEITTSKASNVAHKENVLKTSVSLEPPSPPDTTSSSAEANHSPIPSGQKVHLYRICHSRAGDKGNDLNFSIIPHFPQDFNRLKMIITPLWVKEVISSLLNTTTFPDPEATDKRDKWVNENVEVEIYEVSGIHSLNVVVRNILDGGVNCSRRIDRHGKTISDVVLNQQVILP